MKKYILFFISIGLLLGTVLFYNVFNIEKSKEVTFNESGYILNNLSERFYFYQDEKYTKSYDNKIFFYDTEGSKVTVGNDNFIHYESGNIVALQESVLLDFSKIDNDPIIYYNIGANKEIKKLSNRYTIKNLDTELQLQNALWKISQTKYIVLGDKITIKLNNGTEKEIQGYIEFEYSDNEIVSIYNQELSYQTISSDSYIELPNDIKINLGTKIVSKKDENKMSLEDMVINSDDNVTLVDLNADSTEENETEDENSTENQTNAGSTSNNTSNNISNNSSTSNSNSNSQSTITNQGSGTENNESQTNENTIEIVTPDIKYEESIEGETGVDITKVTVEPKFKLENMKVTSVGISGNIKIIDEEDLLDKEEKIYVKIINNDTGKKIYDEPYDYGKLNIELKDIQTLTPNTSYTIIATATYTVADNTYTKNFLYKTFVTPEIGISVERNGFTDTSLGFIIDFSDSLISEVKVSILNEKGGLIEEKTVKNHDNESDTINFSTGLQSNTTYKLMVSNIKYNDVTLMQDEEFMKIYYDNCKTLKEKATINNINYSIDKRNSKFKLFIEEVIDKDEAIQNYSYVIYEGVKTTDENGKDIIEPGEEVVYIKETTDKEISVDVGKEENYDKIVRDKYYYLRIIGNCYDNEKYVEVGSDLKGPFILNGKSVPTLKFVGTNITPTSIIGTLQIIDEGNTLTIDANNPLRIEYTDSIEGSVIYADYKDSTGITFDPETNTYNIPIAISNKLRANHSYTFSAYGTVDLKDGNEPLKNMTIGSTIVTTDEYETLKGEFTSSSGSAGAFSIGFRLEPNDILTESVENLESITFLLQIGMNFNENEEYRQLKITNNDASAYAGENEDVKNLKDLLYDKTFNISSEDFGGDESYYEGNQYTILATMTIDGTKYKNEISIASTNPEGKTKNRTFTEDGKEYSAIATNINLSPRPNPNPSDPKNAISVVAITNLMANTTAKYQNLDLYDEKLNDDTIVGYDLTAKITNIDQTKIGVKSISYYVWDYNMKKVTDGNKQFVKTVSAKGDTYLTTNNYSVVLKVNNGTTNSLAEDYESGELRRGCSYFFSFSYEYEDKETGNTFLWPFDEESGGNGDESTYVSKLITPLKQKPSIVIYPYTSGEFSMTYKYLCIDYDSALDQTENKAEIICYNELNGYVLDDEMIIGASEYKELEIGNSGKRLLSGVTYELRCEYKLKKTSVNSQELICTKQKFESARYEKLPEGRDGIVYEVEYNYNDKPNKIVINLLNTNDFVSRIAGAKVSLTYMSETQNKEVTLDINKIYDIREDKSNVFIEVDLLELSVANELIGKKIKVNLGLFYDNGIAGFGFEQEDYIAYAILNENNIYNYLGIKDNKLDLTTTQISSDKIFENNALTFQDKEVVLDLKRIQPAITAKYQLMTTENGLKYGEYIVIPKKISLEDVPIGSTGNLVEIGNVKVGIKINSKQEELQKVLINAQLTREVTEEGQTSKLLERIDEKKMYIEICMVDSVDEIVDWDNEIKNGNITTISKDLSSYIQNNEQSFEIVVDNLLPAKYYKLRFRYKDSKLDSNLNPVYMYSPDSLLSNYEYIIGTVKDIGIKKDSIKIQTIFNTYMDKKIKISYNVDEYTSNQYIKTKYEFYEEGKISGQPIGNPIYTLERENPLYNKSTKDTYVEFEIGISPTENKFEFGKNYVLVITPIVEVGGDEIPIESAQKTWETNKLTEPVLGFTFVRKDDKIEIITGFTDTDRVIKGESIGEYLIKIYKDDNDEPIHTFKHTLNDINPKHSIVAERSSKYRAEVVFAVDMKNNGSIIEKKISKTLDAISGDKGIDLGIVYKELIGNKFKITFENSYKLQENVNSIDYQISILGGKQLFGTLGKKVDNNGNIISDESIDWYQEENLIWIILPNEIENTENTSPNIQLNFYNINNNGKKELLAQSQ